MAKSARDYVYDGLELVPGPLSKFVEGRLEACLKGYWQQSVKERYEKLRVSDGRLTASQYVNGFLDKLSSSFEKSVIQLDIKHLSENAGSPT